mgnify:CR=1 FL=1
MTREVVMNWWKTLREAVTIESTNTEETTLVSQLSRLNRNLEVNLEKTLQ